MKPDTVKNFFKGTIDAVEPQSIPEGAASRSLNWMTKGDKIELRRGMRLLGVEITGAGKSYVHVAQKADGTEVLFRKRGRKLEYYTDTTNVWTESGSDVFPAAAVDDEPSWSNYNSLAGAQLFITSPNSSIYKVMVANPGSVTDLLSTTFRGKMRIKNGRSLLWVRKDANGGKDDSGLYGSYIDKDEVSDYTQISAEALGILGSLTYAGTLAFKGAGAKRTCFGITVTDGVETFTDDYNGVLTGSAGGTGTINYTTGAYSVTFHAAAAGAVTATYYWEDSTSAGVCDFTKSTPRTAGQGFVLRQDDGGGKLQVPLEYENLLYCIHERKTWEVNLTNDDTEATNLPFREKVGIPNWQAAQDTGEGIYYVDDTDENSPKVRLLTLAPQSTKVIPVSISENLNLADYRFDKSVVREWGRQILVACRHKDSTENNRFFVYDKLLKSWDMTDFCATTLAIYNGTLVAGDSVTYNVYELFSGLDDDESLISGYWEGNLTDYGIDGLKKAKRFKVQGQIGPEQTIDISISLDHGQPVKVVSISGDGTYVDRGQAVTVGSLTIGRLEVGGGGTDGDIPAYNYEYDFRLGLDRHELAMVHAETTGLGYASVSLYQFKDIRYKGSKVPAKYR